MLNPRDQAFYEWYHSDGNPAASIEVQRKAFMAGYLAGQIDETSDE